MLQYKYLEATATYACMIQHEGKKYIWLLTLIDGHIVSIDYRWLINSIVDW